MGPLDRALGIAEFLLVCASLFWLALAVTHWSEPRARRATICALITGLTLAQPFGVIATAQAALPPAGAQRHPGTQINTLKLLGVLPVPFVLYRRENVISGENTPVATLRARTWLWAPVLINASTIAAICNGSIFVPCWDTRIRDYRLAVFTQGDRTWATISDHYDPRKPTVFTWKLGFGVVSWTGALYWVIAGSLAVHLRRSRLRRRGAAAHERLQRSAL
jgi:hypothetical protein